MPESPLHGRAALVLDEDGRAAGPDDDAERRRRRPSLQSVVTTMVVAAGAFYILLQLQPGLIVADTTAAGGDMGAHVWGPAYLRDHLLPHGRVTGWTPDWYAG